MFANCQMMGMDMGFPDVCLTPAPPSPVPVPIPYPNIAMGPTAVPNVPTVLINFMPAHNMGTVIPMTNGDNAGVNMGVASGMPADADLLDDGHGRQHAGALLGHGAAAGQAGRRCADEPMFECHNLLLAIPVTGGGALPAV